MLLFWPFSLFLRHLSEQPFPAFFIILFHFDRPEILREQAKKLWKLLMLCPIIVENILSKWHDNRNELGDDGDDNGYTLSPR